MLPITSRYGIYCPGAHNWEAAAIELLGNTYRMWSANGEVYGYAPITCEVARVK